MKLRGHGNGVAIALAALAVIIAGTGTAVAVSATVVHIEDGTTAGRFAKVDQSGHLSTTGATSTINSVTTGGSNTYNFMTSPTTATLEITRVAVQDGSANSAIEYELVTTPVTSGSCTQSNMRVLTNENVPSGGTSQALFPTPITVKPAGSAQYCLAVLVFGQSGTTVSIVESLGIQLSAYVAVGSYTGTGTSATPAQHGSVRGGKTIQR